MRLGCRTWIEKSWPAFDELVAFWCMYYIKKDQRKDIKFGRANSNRMSFKVPPALSSDHAALLRNKTKSAQWGQSLYKVAFEILVRLSWLKLGPFKFFFHCFCEKTHSEIFLNSNVILTNLIYLVKFKCNMNFFWSKNNLIGSETTSLMTFSFAFEENWVKL